MKKLTLHKTKTIKLLSILSIASSLLLLQSCSQKPSTKQVQTVKANLNGISLPHNYKNWKVISASHRIDNQSMRIILGNDIAIQASRNKQTNPWPDGSILGKIVFKQKAEDNWPTAIAPNVEEFTHAEFMFKDNKRFAENGTGWGWARWLGDKQIPYGDDNDLDQSCIACHTPVKNKDWVYTTPIKLP